MKVQNLQGLFSGTLRSTMQPEMAVSGGEYSNCYKRINRPPGDYGERREHIWFVEGGRWGTSSKSFKSMNFHHPNSHFFYD